MHILIVQNMVKAIFAIYHNDKNMLVARRLIEPRKTATMLYEYEEIDVESIGEYKIIREITGDFEEEEASTGEIGLAIY